MILIKALWNNFFIKMSLICIGILLGLMLICFLGGMPLTKCDNRPCGLHELNRKPWDPPPGLL